MRSPTSPAWRAVYSRVVQGQTSVLPGLLPDLSYSLMLPFIGHEAAKRESAIPPTPQPVA